MNQHVLISNSSQTLGRLLQQMLSSRGYCTHLSKNFWDSLSIMRQARPDLVILDKHAPECSPVDMCAHCTRYCPDIPILMSGLNWGPNEITDLRNHGVQDVIGGPLETESLLAHVGIALMTTKKQKAS